MSVDPAAPATLTIADATNRLVAELAPDELVLVPLVSADFFGRPAARRAIARRVLRPPGRDVPAALSPEAGQLIVQTVILVLNGIVTQAFLTVASRRFGGLGAWWRVRRAVRGAVAPEGADSPLPQLSAVDAARVGRLVRDLALRAGLSEEVAQTLANLVAAMLQRPVR